MEQRNSSLEKKKKKKLWYNVIQPACSTIKIKLIRNLFRSWFNSIVIPFILSDLAFSSFLFSVQSNSYESLQCIKKKKN